VPATPAETDPSVCYRHPDRTSWTLCTRCGRTICPECQILTPAGVRCPDCVREEGGTVRWEPAAGPRPAARAKRTRRARSSLGEALSATTLPVVTIATGAIALILWILGLFTGSLPFTWLAAFPDEAWQVWRYVTSGVAYPSFGPVVVFVILSIGIFTFIGWSAERQFGRRRYLELLIATTAGAAAITVLAGGVAYGLMGAIWGITGAYLIVIWPHTAARNRVLLSIAIWLLVSVFLGGNLLAIVGGTLSGVGAMLLFRRYDDRPSQARRPHLIIAGALLALVALAVARTLLTGALA
jgi:membrane associated rhomboid family serine protease